MRTAPLPFAAPRALSLALTVSLLLAVAAPWAPAHAQRAGTSIWTSVPGAQAGGEVTVQISDLAPGLSFQLGFGGLSSNHEILATGEADTDGRFSITVRIPEWVERHRTYHFFLAYAGQPPRSISNPFIATAADGFVRVAGSITSAVDGCAVMRAFDETVYTLLGTTGTLGSGARVVVEGTLAVPDPTGTSAAPCAQGGAIPVRVRQVLPG